MIGADITLRVALAHMRPVPLDLHDLDVLVFVDRAQQARIGVHLLADGEVDVRCRSINGLKRGWWNELRRQLDALVRGLQIRDGACEHIALNALLDDAEPLLAQLQDIHRLALEERIELLRRAAHLRADGQRLAGHAKIERLRLVVVASRIRQILHVLGEDVAPHAVLLDERPGLLIVDDIDELTGLHAAQLFGGGGFLLSYGHRLGDRRGIHDLLCQGEGCACRQRQSDQKRNDLLHASIPAGHARLHFRTGYAGISHTARKGLHGRMRKRALSASVLLRSIGD